MERSNVIMRAEATGLAPLQRRIWDRRKRRGVELHAVFQCEIRETLDTARMQKALRRVVRRFEILRAYYPTPNGADAPAPVFAASYEPTLEILMPASEHNGGLAEFLDSAYSDLQSEPVLLEEHPHSRFILIKHAEDHFYLIGSIPSINADKKSVQQLISEWVAAYYEPEDAMGDQARPQFYDVVAWLNSTASRSISSAAEKFWAVHLAKVPWDLELPIERISRQAAACKIATMDWELPAAVAKGLARDAEGENLLRIQLSTAVATWLARTTGRGLVYVGVAFDGRTYNELQTAVGPYECYLPLIVDVTETTTFESLEKSVRNGLEELEKWREWFPPEHGRENMFAPSETVGYPICVDVNRGDPILWRASAPFRLTRLTSPADSFAIKITAEFRGDSLQIEIQYDQATYGVEAIKRLRQQLDSTLSAMGEHRQSRVMAVDLLSREERASLLGPSTGVGLVADCAVHELFERQVERSPDAIALVEEHLHLSYGCVNAIANRLAHKLRLKIATGPEVVVAVCLRTQWEVHLATFAILKTGSAYVAVDPDWPEERSASVLQESGARVVLTDDEAVGRPKESGMAHIICDGKALWSDASLPITNLGVSIDPDNLAYVLFTSGTSGVPKGVMITHRGFANYIIWCAGYYDIAQGRGAIVHSPLTFDFTLTCLLAPLTVGRSVYLCKSASPLEGLVEALSRLDEISMIKITPTSIDPLLRLMKVKHISCRVECVVIGGEALWGGGQLRSLARQLGATIVNEYGPTETVVGSSVYRLGPHLQEEGPIPVGRAIANTGLRLLKRDGHMAETWTEAEIHIGGSGLARGYLKRPGITAASFIPHPDRDQAGKRLYRTGDAARYLTHGDILYLRRRDSQVKIRGHRIELTEVEAALRRHASVIDCVLTVVTNGDRAAQLVAFLVAGEHAGVDVLEVRRHLAAILPEYMIPAAFHVVPQIPATTNGKTDLEALHKMLTRAEDRTRPAITPRSEVEKILHQLWCEVLGRDTVSVDDNFFEIGGDSILVIQLLARANTLGLRLRPRDLRHHPTIGELSRLVERTAASAAPTERLEGAVALAPIQKRFFEWNLQDPNHYNQSVLLVVPNLWTSSHFQQAFQALVDHHDALRLRFEKRGTGYYQFYAKHCNSDFIRLATLGASSEAERRRNLEELARESQASLNLEQAPLMRVILCEPGGLERNDILVYIVVHHLIVDHVSWTILLADLHSALEQAAAGVPIDLPQKTASYRTWVETLKSCALRGDLEKAKTYWLSERWKKVPPLPVDFPGEPRQNQVEDEESASVSLSCEETHALQYGTTGAYGTRVIELLLAAYCMAYARWSGTCTLAMDMEHHGRNADAEVVDSRTVGWFTSVFPVCINLTSPAEIRRSIQEVKEALRAVPEDGASYGVMRYLTEDERLRQICEDMHQNGVVFNYLGEIDRAAVPGSFQWLRSSLAENRSRKNTRPYLLEIGAYISKGALEVNFTYSRRRHRSSSISSLAGTFVEQLKAIVSHCCAQQERSYTPSDFPLAKLTQDSVDWIHAENPDIEDAYPLTPTQQGILFHATHEATASSYLVQVCVALSGRLNKAFFEESWRKVIQRHAALRTSFLWESLAEPLQIVHRTMDVAFLHEDWRAECEDRQKQRLNLWLQEQRDAGIELTLVPLHRFAIFQTSDEQYHFVWTFHHILMDGWSTSNVLREVLSAYLELLGRVTPQDRPARPYREYVEWLQARIRQKENPYWEQRMAGVTAGTALRVPRAEAHTEPKARVHQEELLALTPEESGDLLALASRLRITVNAIIQGAWALVLSRYSGTDDVIFGVTVSGRPYDLPDVEDRVGLFINTVPVRIKVQRGATVSSYLKLVSNDLQEMLEHEYTPLVEIQKICNLSDRKEIFESILVFENYPRAFDLGSLEQDLRVEGMSSAEQTNYPVTVVVGTWGGQVSIKIVYAPWSFDRAVIQQILGYFVEILRRMAKSVDLRLADCVWILPDHGGTEKRNPPAEADEWTLPIHRIFEAQASRHAESVAIVDAGQTVTYGTLNRRANQFARYLVGAGVRPGTCVLICMERSADMIVALLAILKAGAAYVPVDSHFPAKRIEFIAKGVPVVVTESGLRERFAGTASRVIDTKTDARSIFTGRGDDLSEVATGVEQVAYLMYTSGSSGQPKGALVTHHNVTRLFRSALGLYEFHRDGVWSFFHSIAFDFSVWEIFGALLTGGRLVVTPYWVARSPDQFAELVRRERVTVLSQTPSAFQQLLTLGQLMDRDPAQISLKWVVFGGEALYMQPLRSFYGELERRGVRLVNMYGITETTVHVTHRLIDYHEDLGNGSFIGEALPDLQIHLLDQAMYPVPDKVVGEICVVGEGLATGYANAPRLTAERFMPNPFGDTPGTRLYRSGDLGRAPGHFDIEYLGRGDHQVKIRGFRIELDEVRFHLMQHASVRDALVRAVEDDAGDRILAAYVVPNAPDVSLPSLWKDLREHLPEHMIPAVILVLDRFPLTPNGKVDYNALPSTMQTNQTRKILVPPQTWEQDLVADIWSEVLGGQRVDIREDFFTVGGDSIKALRVIGRLRSMGFAVSIETLFEHPTINEFCQVLRPAADPLPETERLPRDDMAGAYELPEGSVDAYPLTQLQLGMLFHSVQDASAYSAYHNVSMFKLQGSFDEGALRWAAERLMAAHPVLRTAFELQRYDIAVQVVYKTVPLPLTIRHIETLSPEEQETYIDNLVEKEKAELFEYNTAPLIRFQVAVCGHDAFYLVLTEHHAILDGWSVASMLTELFQNYMSGRSQGTEDIPYSSTTNVFRSYVALEREALACRRHQEFWKDYLDGCVPLRLGMPNRWREGLPAEVRKRRITLDDALTGALKSFARDAHVPLKSVLLSAHLAVLGFFANTREAVTGLITHGRPDVEGGEAGLGLFLNTLPLRLRQVNCSWKEWVKRVFNEEKRLLPYRRYPLAAMRDQLGQRLDLATAFNYVNFHVYDSLEQDAKIKVLESYVHEETNFDLLTDFSLLSRTAQLDLTLSYNASRLSESEVADLADSYSRCLTLMAAHPSANMATAFMDDFARPAPCAASIVAGWSSETPADLRDLIATTQGPAWSDRVALVDGDRHVSYQELWRNVSGIAARLARLGVVQDGPVAVLMNKSVEWAIAALSVIEAGGVYVPIDPNDPAERINYIIDDTRAQVVVTDAVGAKLVSSSEARVVVIECPQKNAGRYHLPRVLPDHLAYIIYTSGSTGKPKGVAMHHRGITNLMRWQSRVMPMKGQRILQYAPTGFDVSVQEIFTALSGGNTLVIVPGETRRDFMAVAHLVAEQQIECLFAPYTVINTLFTAARSCGVRLDILGSIINAGESLIVDPNLVDFVARQGRLFNQYGPTESHVVTSCLVSVQETGAASQPSIGRGIENTEVLVLDHWQRPLPTGSTGEMYIASVNVARHYHRAPRLTAERFVPNSMPSCAPGDRLFRTGDLGYRDASGSLYFMGRLDKQVKLRGYRIEPDEVRHAFLQHPAVEDAVVWLAEHKGEKKLVAGIVQKQQVGTEELREFLGKTLPSYMVPFAIIPIPSVPLTKNGKVSYADLPKLDTVALPEPGRIASEKASDGDLLRLWQEVLRETTLEFLGGHDFLQVGGDSILLLQLQLKIQAHFGVKVSIAQLAINSTFEQMSDYIKSLLYKGSSSGLRVGGESGTLRESSPDSDEGACEQF